MNIGTVLWNVTWQNLQNRPRKVYEQVGQSRSKALYFVKFVKSECTILHTVDKFLINEFCQHWHVINLVNNDMKRFPNKELSLINIISFCKQLYDSTETRAITLPWAWQICICSCLSTVTRHYSGNCWHYCQILIEQVLSTLGQLMNSGIMLLKVT